MGKQVSIAGVLGYFDDSQGLALMTTLMFYGGGCSAEPRHNILVQEQPAVEVLARLVWMLR